MSQRLCSASQWRALARSRVIEVGAHTVSHARLAAETVEDQQGEIVENRRRIEQVIGKPIRAFSYPFGTRDAFMPETVQLVREAGFACACANFARRVGPQTDPMRLPRFVVRDWPIEEFRRHFANWSQAAPAY